jgi:hypothetical protein
MWTMAFTVSRSISMDSADGTIVVTTATLQPAFGAMGLGFFINGNKNQRPWLFIKTTSRIPVIKEQVIGRTLQLATENQCDRTQ